MLPESSGKACLALYNSGLETELLAGILLHKLCHVAPAESPPAAVWVELKVGYSPLMGIPRNPLVPRKPSGAAE